MGAILTGGHCFGFSCLWLFCKNLSLTQPQQSTKDQERDDLAWFNKTIDTITAWDGKNLSALDQIQKENIERMLNHIVFLQINLYLPDKNRQSMATMEVTRSKHSPEQNTIPKEICSITVALDNEATRRKQQFRQLIPQLAKPNMMVLSITARHARAIMQDEAGNYYYFDPNNPLTVSQKPTTLDELIELMSEYQDNAISEYNTLARIIEFQVFSFKAQDEIKLDEGTVEQSYPQYEDTDINLYEELLRQFFSRAINDNGARAYNYSTQACQNLLTNYLKKVPIHYHSYLMSRLLTTTNLYGKFCSQLLCAIEKNPNDKDKKELLATVINTGNGMIVIDNIFKYNKHLYTQLLETVLITKLPEGSPILYVLAKNDPDKYWELCEKAMQKQDLELFNTIINAKLSDGSYAIYWLAKSNPDKYWKLYEKAMQEQDQELFNSILTAKLSDGSYAIYWLAENNPNKYWELCEKVMQTQDQELFRTIINAKLSDGSHAIYWLAEKEPVKYLNLIVQLLQTQQPFLVQVLLQLKAPNTNKLMINLIAAKDIDEYINLLEKIKSHNDASTYIINALGIQTNGSSTVIEHLATNSPDKYKKLCEYLLKTLNENPDIPIAQELLEAAIKTKLSNGDSAIHWLAKNDPEKYGELLKFLQTATPPDQDLIDIALRELKDTQDSESSFELQFTKEIGDDINRMAKKIFGDDTTKFLYEYEGQWVLNLNKFINLFNDTFCLPELSESKITNMAEAAKLAKPKDEDPSTNTTLYTTLRKAKGLTSVLSPQLTTPQLLIKRILDFKAIGSNRSERNSTPRPTN